MSSLYAVAPVTIRIFSIGFIDVSYVYISALRVVYFNMMNFLARQHVLALVSYSRNAVVLGSDSKCFVSVSQIFLFVDTAPAWCHPLLDPCLCCSCSFLPPIYVEPVDT